MQQFRYVLARYIGRVALNKNNRILAPAGQLPFMYRNQHSQKICHENRINQRISGTISKTELYQGNEMIKISFSDCTHLDYPSIWLRDNCQCSSCFSPALHSRTIYWRDFDISVKPTSISHSEGTISIQWSDGHESNYELSWLHERSFTEESRDKWQKGTYKLPKKPWGSTEFPNILKRFAFHDVLQSDHHLLEWLKSLAVYGVAIVTDTPPKDDQLRLLANRVCFIKRTHYGEEFEVRHKPDTTNQAYLSTPLQMHADLPYYEYKPGVNLLHCLVQTISEGGENELADILHISNQLKQTHPDVYKILSRTPVDWSDIGEDGGIRFHSLYRSPVLCEDHWGQFARVNYSHQQRDSHFSVPLQDVIPWYKALDTFTKALYHKDNVVQFKTKPGDILTFDNVRLVHGRAGYKDTSDNERHLIGAYMDWDIVYSRIRELSGSLHRA